jgi:hypothetical protein
VVLRGLVDRLLHRGDLDHYLLQAFVKGFHHLHDWEDLLSL